MTRELLDINKYLGGYFKSLSSAKDFTIVKGVNNRNFKNINMIIIPRDFTRNGILSDQKTMQVRIDNDKCNIDDFNDLLLNFKNYKLPVFDGVQMDFYYNSIEYDGEDEHGNDTYSINYQINMVKI